MKRLVGLDVARAIAILGMVLVNYHAMASVGDEESPGLLWALERIEGRAAALFVVIAGVGIALRTRRAVDAADPAAIRDERTALLRRAMALAIVGALNLHVWEWDILHNYALFVAVAATLLTWRPAALLGLAGAIMAFSAFLLARFDYHETFELWTVDGMLTDLLFGGLYPFFPWFAFLLVGMSLGRLDLDRTSLRVGAVTLGFLLLAGGEALDSIATERPELLGLGMEDFNWFGTWPRPPSPTYALSAIGAALITLVGCLHLAEGFAHAPWIRALERTGQLALTHYILHAVAINVAEQHDVLVATSAVTTTLAAVGFFAAAMLLSLWWRGRHPHGPLESLLRQMTARSSDGSGHEGRRTST